MEEILRKLVSFPTVTEDTQPVHEALDYIATFVAQRGMHVERFDSNGFESLVATVQPGDKTPKVMLAGHLDVTPAADEAFELRVSEGKLYGRGTLDMKFAIAAYLQFVDDHKESLTDYNFGIMITTDEEVGGYDGTKQLVDEGYIPEVCVLPDGGDNWQVQVSSKGFYYLELRSYGTPAHGSRPWLGDNALFPLMEALQEIRRLFDESRAENPTFNLGKLHGGGAVNQVADEATAAIDVRYVTETEKHTLLEQIKNICDAHAIALTVNLDGAATRFDLSNPLIAPFVRAITDITGVKVTGSHTLGSNDTRFFMEHSVPCISVYPPGGGHHGTDEWISQQGLLQFGQVLDRYMQQVAKK